MRISTLITAAAAAMALAGALPSVAGATDYCVLPKTGCPPENTKDTLEAALAEAYKADDFDRVLLDEGTYRANAPSGFYYGSGYNPVEIAGAGRGRTILTSPEGGSGQVLFLSGPTGTSVHDLTIRIPNKVASSFDGLELRGLAQRIDVIENPDQPNYHRGVRLFGPGTLVDSRVTLGPTALGVWMADGLINTGANVVRNSVVNVDEGVYIDGDGRIERSVINSASAAVSAHGGEANIVNSVLRFPGKPGWGLFAAAVAPRTTVNLDGVTMLGTVEGTSSVGILASTSAFPDAAVEVNLTNSILRANLPLVTDALGNGRATITTRYSDYDQARNKPPLGNVAINESNILNVGDPGFADSAAGDYRLRAGSPLIDAGDPDSASGADLDGSPLIADGNGDGSARRDIGAFELQPAPVGAPPTPTPTPAPAADTAAPVIGGFRAAKSRIRVAHGTRFRYTLSENARVTLRFRRIGAHGRQSAVGTLKRAGSKGLNRVRFSGRIGRRALLPGRYRVVATAVDPAGNRSTPKVARLRIVR